MADFTALTPLELTATWKVKVRVEVNGVWANTYYKPDLPQPRIEAHERMVNMGRMFNVDDGLDLKARGLNSLAYQGPLNGDTVRREMETVQV